MRAAAGQLGAQFRQEHCTARAEQSWKFEALLLERLHAGVEGLPELDEPCLVPDGFFVSADDASDEGERVRVRYRGPINPEDEFVDGITWVRGDLKGEDLALYGFGTLVNRLEGESPVLVFRSEGPTLAMEIDRRVTRLTIPAELLAGKDGVLSEDAFPDELSILLTERPAEDQPEAGKDCVWAVPDRARAAKLAICGGEDFQASPGQTLKLFADLPVTTDAAAVEAWLLAANRPRCQ